MILCERMRDIAKDVPTWRVCMKKSRFLLKASKFTIEPTDENDVWNCDWVITNRDDKEQMGTVSFAGEKALGTVPIRIELIQKYRDRGIGTEVIRMMVDWAFLHKNVYEVTAVTEHENDRCINALQKAGFVFRDKEGKEETYSITKPKSTWTGLYIIIGFISGLILGIVFENSWLGMAMGIVAGVAAGAILDSGVRKDREKVTGKKQEKSKIGRK